MAELKTKPTKASVSAFIDAIEDGQKKKDAKKIAAMMRKATGRRAKMWGTQIVGFGSYYYTNTAGKDFEWPLIGFSPRKQALSVYIMPGVSRFDGLLKKLGKYKNGKSCLYIKRLSDVDERVMERLINESVKRMRKAYKTK
ncbi:MAG: DUF1801 domain-containing protein [Gammaproteobacteria bacterium]|nr:DUF1801 domain-containing protein [Gammaproteobacteria bacterium]